MTTPVTPAGLWVHARFSPEIKSRFLEWVDANSPKYIVGEETANRLHYHIAFETALGIESIKKKLQAACKDLGLVTQRGKSNSWYGGVKECTDTSYVCKDGNIVAHKNFSPLIIESLIQEGKEKYHKLPQHTGHPQMVVGDVIRIVEPPKKKSVAMKAQFVQYMETQCKWKENAQITESTYVNDLDDLIDHLTDFWKNAFTTPQGAVCIEHAKWYFADDEVRLGIKAKNRHVLKKFLRE